MEALKIKLSRLLCQRRKVRILATSYYDYDTELLNNFTKKYLVNMEKVEVMGLEKLCRDLNIEYYDNTPCDTINRVIASLAAESDSDTVTVLLVDEVRPCASQQTTPDWRHLEVRENVIWLLGLTPRAYGATSTEVLQPVNSSVLTRHLIHKHRNCLQIRNFIETFKKIFFYFF